MICAQSGKTETMLDIVGQHFDQRPAPLLYVGPTRDFIERQFEPRVMALLDEAPALAAKVLRGKKMAKTRKVIAGNPLRLAHAGSSTALKSDPARRALTDEVDELMANVKGQGDPIALIDRRGDTYADFMHGAVSTPSIGVAETVTDEKTGLIFWKPQQVADIQSKIWQLWQAGTMHHWAWRCRHCREFFVPRFDCLKWPKGAPPSEARRSAVVCCPRCGGVHEEADKAALNAEGVFVAPGQRISAEGVVEGDPPESRTVSFWVSGLASPFVSFGERAEEYLEATRSGDSEKQQAVVNGGFGEIWSPSGGDAPEWLEVLNCRSEEYVLGRVPSWVVFLTAGIDVQANRLVYVVRGWGARQQSALVAFGEIAGETKYEPVWLDLQRFLETPIDGVPIGATFVDAGFRPGKAQAGDPHMVYEFCRRNPRLAFASKGYDRRDMPVSLAKIEVKPSGKKPPYGLDLARVDSDFLKSWVHARIRWPKDQPGGWLLPADISDHAGEGYCRQIVAEARARKAGGGHVWVRRSRENHFLDCFDSQTELLTEDGWLPMPHAVAHQGRFATVNLATDEIEYQRATASVVRMHVGEMVEIKGRTLDLLVTPNHRMIATRHNPPDPTERIVAAGDLMIWHKLKKTARWTGRNDGPVVLPAVDIAIPKRGPLREPERTIDAGDWCEFLGWFVAEGHIIRSKNSGRVFISQNPGLRQDRIRALIGRMGFEFSLANRRQITIASRQLIDALQDCAGPGEGRGCYRKRVPAFVRAATPSLIERFLDAAILGDGWQQRGFRTYATVSRKLADDVQELFLKIGKSGNLRVRTAQPILLRGHCSTNTVDQYHVSETSKAYACLRTFDNTPVFRRIPFEGDVYCVSVPNTTLIARRNGLPCIVGNCEALAYAAAYLRGVTRLAEGAEPAARIDDTPQPPRAPKRRRDDDPDWVGATDW